LPGHDLIPDDNIFDGNGSALGDDWFAFGDAYLVHPHVCGGVSAADVGVIGAIAVDLATVREPDHRPRGLDVLEVLLRVVSLAGQHIQDPGRAFDTDLRGI
jgi:hypothetical protein